MNIETSDDWEPAAIAWLVVQAKRLRQVMQDQGVTDEQQQRNVCEHFLFHLAEEFDAALVPPPNPQPVLAFDAGESLLVSGGVFDLHDYVFGISAEVFDQS